MLLCCVVIITLYLVIFDKNIISQVGVVNSDDYSLGS